MSGSCAFNLGWSISELTAGSNLRVSGLYYLISPSSILGRSIGRIAPPVRYLHMGAAWALNTKYKGAANVNSTGGHSSTLNTHPHTEFAAAGQDAIAVVIPSVLRYRREPTQRNKITDYRISSTELCYFPCGSCCHQSKSQSELDLASNI